MPVCRKADWQGYSPRAFPPYPEQVLEGLLLLTLTHRCADPSLTPPLPPESSGFVGPRSLSPAALPLKAVCTLERSSGVKWGGEGIQD